MGATLSRATKPTRLPAGIAVRLAAMVYEAILLFGVVFVVGYALLAVARWTYPLSGPQRTVVQGVLFAAIGIYFVYQWTRSGQTLAMKAWNLRLVDHAGVPPRLPAAVLRYVAAWHLVLPGLLWSALSGGRGAVDALVWGVGFLLLMVPARFDRERRLLHDRLSATRVIREAQVPKR